MLPPIKHRVRRRRDNGAPLWWVRASMFDDSPAAQRRRWCVKHGRAADSSLESRRLYGRFSNLAQKIAESEQPWQNAEAEEQEPHPRPLKMGFDVAIKTEQSCVHQDHGQTFREPDNDFKHV